MATTAGRAAQDYIGVGDIGGPDPLRPVFEAIDEARGMLTWPDNWDGEGSPGYAKATWDRAAAFVRDNAVRLWEDEGKVTDARDIQPGAMGRIIVEWSAGDRELVVAVPAEATEQAEFYGHDSGRTITIKGKLDIDSSRSHWLLLWTVR